MSGPGREGLPLIVANKIRNEINRGDLRPGDKLPTEHELSKLHGVSRVVIREAIARLRHEGIAMSRQGLGVFVVSPGSPHSLVLEAGSLSRLENFRHLYELRLIMEAGAAGLAARNHGDADLLEISQSLEDLASATMDEAAYVAADMRFHRAVSGASANPFVATFISFVEAKLRESILLALRGLDLGATARVSFEEHGAVFAAIRNRHPRAASNAMKSHLRNASRRLRLTVSDP